MNENCLPEHLLLQRLQQKDETALAETYDLYSGVVFGVLLKFLDQGTAEEVLQDVFLRLWNRPEMLDLSRGTMRAFLLVMARSRALDKLRAQKATVPLQTEEGYELPLSDERVNPAKKSEQEQQRGRVQAAIAELSEVHRETVTRAFLKGQTREEISVGMGVPVGTVKSRISYALKHLKRVLGEEGSAWLD